jgi:soluble lytic murein transglycosylase-like protein
MGQLARELGFKGKFLSELCDPLVGLEYLCRALNQKLGFAGGNMEKALLFYNGGGNPNYPTEVLARVEKYKSQEAT